MGERCIARGDQWRPHSAGGNRQQTTGDERGVMDVAKTPCSTTIYVHTKACSVVLDGFTRVDLLILLLCLDEQ